MLRMVDTGLILDRTCASSAWRATAGPGACGRVWCCPVMRGGSGSGRRARPVPRRRSLRRLHDKTLCPWPETNESGFVRRLMYLYPTIFAPSWWRGEKYGSTDKAVNDGEPHSHAQAATVLAYPVITEQAFYQQNRHDARFVDSVGVFDLRADRTDRPRGARAQKHPRPRHTYYTCCQHICFRYFVDIWRTLGIRTAYVSHKKKGEDVLRGVVLKPCPLYAVNLEDPTKNAEFRHAEDLVSKERTLLYSFAGGYQSDYLTDIRKKIFSMPHQRDNVCVQNTGDWHFNKVVYGGKQNVQGDVWTDESHTRKTRSYNELLLSSRYTLAPSGTGPNSIRLWEALGAGSIPVLLADTLDLPDHPLWEHSIVRIAEQDLHTLRERLDRIDPAEEQRRRENCVRIYDHFRNNYANRGV